MHCAQPVKPSMKKQRWAVGAIIKIPIGKGRYSYGQLLSMGSIAVFEHLDDGSTDLTSLTGKSILFIVTIYANVIPSGRWEKVGKLTLRPSLEKLPLKFIQDSLKLENVELYDPNDGTIKKATKEKCVGLEAASVWAAEHIESRILDHFEGKQNVWVERLALK